MSKTVWTWDTDGFVKDFDTVADDYQLKDNETFSSPLDQNGFLNPATKWISGAWVKPTAEDEAAYAAKLAKKYPAPTPSTPAGPSAEQQMIATLGQQQAKTDASVKQMQQMIAMLGSQMASSDAKEKANGGN